MQRIAARTRLAAKSPLVCPLSVATWMVRCLNYVPGAWADDSRRFRPAEPDGSRLMPQAVQKGLLMYRNLDEAKKAQLVRHVASVLPAMTERDQSAFNRKTIKMLGRAAALHFLALVSMAMVASKTQAESSLKRASAAVATRDGKTATEIRRERQVLMEVTAPKYGIKPTKVRADRIPQAAGLRDFLQQMEARHGEDWARNVDVSHHALWMRSKARDIFRMDAVLADIYRSDEDRQTEALNQPSHSRDSRQSQRRAKAKIKAYKKLMRVEELKAKHTRTRTEARDVIELHCRARFPDQWQAVTEEIIADARIWQQLQRPDRAAMTLYCRQVQGTSWRRLEEHKKWDEAVRPVLERVGELSAIGQLAIKLHHMHARLLPDSQRTVRRLVVNRPEPGPFRDTNLTGNHHPAIGIDGHTPEPTGPTKSDFMHAITAEAARPEPSTREFAAKLTAARISRESACSSSPPALALPDSQLARRQEFARAAALREWKMRQSDEQKDAAKLGVRTKDVGQGVAGQAKALLQKAFTLELATRAAEVTGRTPGPGMRRLRIKPLHSQSSHRSRR